MKYRVVYDPTSECYPWSVEERKSWFDFWIYTSGSLSKTMEEALNVVEKHKSQDMSRKYYYCP